jgi:hypothetical protein
MTFTSVEKRKLNKPEMKPYFKAITEEETLDSFVELSIAIFYNKVKLTNLAKSLMQFFEQNHP